MRLSQSQKHLLIQQLYELSSDTQLKPYLDLKTTHRINTFLSTINATQQSINKMTPTRLSRQTLNMSKNKKHTTQLQQIDQINQQYEKNFAHLFASDEDNSDSGNILKEINVHLNTQAMAKSIKIKKATNIIENPTEINDNNHTKSYQLTTSTSKSNQSKLPKQNFTNKPMTSTSKLMASTSKLLASTSKLMTSSKKQNISSMTSTHSNLFNTKTNNQLTTLYTKPSRQKLISYKIKTQSTNYNYDISTPSPNKLLKKNQKTLGKNILTATYSKSNLQHITKSPITNINNNSTTILKRPLSQSTKHSNPTTIMNPSSLNSTSKHQKLPLLRPSLSTSKLKSTSKKSISVLQTTTGTKRQLNSLPSIELCEGNLKVKIIKGIGSESDSVTASKIKDGKKRSKSKSKERHAQSTNKRIKRSHTQCSVQKLHLRDGFLEQMRLDQELNFDLVTDDKSQNTAWRNNKKQAIKPLVAQLSPQKCPQEYEQFQFYQQSQEQSDNDPDLKRQNSQKELQEELPISFDDKDRQDLQVSNMLQQKSRSQYMDDKNAGYQCLKRIMGEINQRRQEKMRQKVQCQRQIIELKQKIIQEKKLLESTLLANSKLQNHIQSLCTQIKSTTSQHSLTSRSLHQTRKATTSLRQTLTKNQSTLTKLTTEDLKQQQQLIQMYNKVIDQLKAEIKEQLKKKLQAKGMLQMCHKQKQGKMTRFNSTLMSSQRLKSNLTDAFKEWV